VQSTFFVVLIRQNYPLAPRHNVRDALTWLEGVYKAMTRRYMPRNITFIGDSAGAKIPIVFNKTLTLH